MVLVNDEKFFWPSILPKSDVQTVTTDDENIYWHYIGV